MIFNHVILMCKNVRGLSNLSNKYSIWDTHLKYLSIDFLCVQEIKIVTFILIVACHVIWLDGLAFSLEHEAKVFIF